eukprot:scaffold379_cov235-Pinguiococcus_pyrenoidosus.AAC.14
MSIGSPAILNALRCSAGMDLGGSLLFKCETERDATALFPFWQEMAKKGGTKLECRRTPPVSNLLRNSLDLHKDLLVNGPESARQEAVEHGQRGFRLVHGCHVASVVYLQELQLASASEQSDLAQAFNRPWLVLGVIESLLAVPVQIQGPRLVAHEVADEVQIA